ncbi:MAG: glycosyltransferase [Clostridia bacterium]|nr:glycosyltransferase [Clostridia bacterium]
MDKKIIFFSGAMGRGGAERVISILSEAYAKKGWKVKIATVLHSQVDYVLADGVEVVDLSPKEGIKKGLFKTLKKIRRFVKEEKPNVVVAFMAQICLLVGFALKGIKTPLIVSERIDPSQVKRSFLYKKLLNNTYQKSDVVVFQTERAKNYFNKKIRDKSVIIANPIKVNTEIVENGKRRIVTAGRLEKQKNQKMLIAAFAEFKKTHPEYSLTIYGEGPLRGELEAQVKALALTDSVELPGNLLDLHEQMKDAQIFVLPSDFEGLSNALLEAMMMGFPVVSTDCAGSDEVIKNGENGLLIPVSDEGALLEALNKLADDPVLRTRLSQNARLSVEPYKTENIIQKWEDAIEKAQ